MTTLYDYLSAQKCLTDVVLPPGIDELLRSLAIVSQTGATGTVQASAAIPLFFSFSLPSMGPAIPFVLSAPDTSVTPNNAFSLLLDFSKISPIDTVLGLSDLAAAGLNAADIHTGDQTNEVWLDQRTTAPAGSPPGTSPTAVKVTGLGFGLIVEAPVGGTAKLRFSPSAAPSGGGTNIQPAGIITLGLSPPTVLIGDTGFGIGLSTVGMTIDLSTDSAPADPAMIESVNVTSKLPSNSIGWRGLSIRNARLYLPSSVPIFGKTACDLNLEIGLAPAVGISLSAVAHALAVPGERPAMTIKVECIDPAATGLESFVPTFVEAIVELPVPSSQPISGQDGTSGNLSLLTGKIVARARFSRAPATGDGKTRLSIALEGQADGAIGDGAIATVRPVDANDKIALYAIGAAGFATALIAYKNKEGAQSYGMASLMIGGGVMAALLASTDGASGDDATKAAALISAGRVRVNAVELSASGPGFAIDQTFEMLLDYSVDLPIRPVRIGSLNIGLDPAELLRIRLRNVSVTYDTTMSRLDRFKVDFKHATTDVEDPGHWLVDGGVGNLFDVVGTRSGKGSTWFEIDLRFKVDLGPIRVSGATIRVTLDDNFKPSVGIRGLDASFAMPGVISVKGGLKIGGPTGGAGFSAHLSASIVPLGIGADGFLVLKDNMVLVGLTCDLPAPIPLGATGFGLYDLGGTFGINAALTPATTPFALLSWAPDTGFVPATGEYSFGVQASVGTLPDRAFSLGAKAGLFLTVPDVAVMGVMDAVLFKGPVSKTAPVAQAPSVSIRGAVSVVPAQTSFAVAAKAGVPGLVEIDVPVAGLFPAKSNDWYVYFGADGAAQDGRDIGPARMKVLPGLLDLKANAYLMLRGKGLTNWPVGTTGGGSGFVIAFGFSTSFTFGVKPIAYAEVSGGADIMIATSPLVVAGFGHIDGKFHLGPVSLGVSATLTVLIQDGNAYVTAEVCGRIHLLFISVHRCATISFGTKPALAVPPPASLPIERQSQLADGTWVTGLDIALMTDDYRRTGDYALGPNAVPVVWPDTLIRIGFAWAPGMAPGWTKQFNGDGLTLISPQPIGSDYLSYLWQVDKIVLQKQLPDKTWADLPGPLSAAWQSGKSGDIGELAQPVELVLLSAAPAIWLERMGDTSGLPYDPLAPLATSCRPRINAREGWLLGGMAQHPASLCTLPPEFASANPLQSRIKGKMTFSYTGAGGKQYSLLGLLTILPSTMGFVPPGILKGPWALLRAFEASLMLPCIVTPVADLSRMIAGRGQRPQLTATLLLDEPIVSGMLWLASGLPGLTADQATAGAIRISDETGDWPLQLFDSGTGNPTHTLAFILPVGHTARRITIRYDFGIPVALLGLEGITASARAAAAKAQAAAQSKAGQLKNSAAASPGDGNSYDTRCLLERDTAYRLQINLSWKAQRFTQDEGGNKVPAGTNAGAASRIVSFRTAAAYQGPNGEPASDPTTGSGDNYHRHLYQYENNFDPAMLVRFVAGSEPAQGEVDRLYGDPIRFHWSAGHVARLAGLYGFALEIAVQRTDIGGDAGQTTVPPQQLVKPTNPGFLVGAAQRLHALSLTTDCPIPFDGATSDVPVVLAPRAWYDTYPRIRRTTETEPVCRLPGTTFRTSRWQDAPAMMGGLGFPASGRGASAGDLAIVAPGAMAGASGDAAFDDALRRLGLDRWPVCVEPRVSLLWSKASDAWRLCGVLIESPEPIERPGRTANARLAPMLAPGTAGSFETKIVDRSGSRLLFFTGAPILPAAWPDPVRAKPGPFTPSGPIRGSVTTPVRGGGIIGSGGISIGGIGAIARPTYLQPGLVLTLDDLPLDKPQISLTGTLTLPTTPLFANEAF